MAYAGPGVLSRAADQLATWGCWVGLQSSTTSQSSLTPPAETNTPRPTHDFLKLLIPAALNNWSSD